MTHCWWPLASRWSQLGGITCTPWVSSGRPQLCWFFRCPILGALSVNRLHKNTCFKLCYCRQAGWPKANNGIGYSHRWGSIDQEEWGSLGLTFPQIFIVPFSATSHIYHLESLGACHCPAEERRWGAQRCDARGLLLFSHSFTPAATDISWVPTVWQGLCWAWGDGMA